MKTLFCVLCIAISVYAQTNPDGYIGGFSLHVTPSVDWGTAEYGGEGGLKFGTFDYPTRWGLALKIVAPLSEKVTMSFAYGFHSLDSDFKPSDKIRYIDEQIRGSLHRLSGTLILYFK